MLPYEVEPFAQEHITALRDMRDAMQVSAASHPYDKTIEIPRDVLELWWKQLDLAASALVRFKVCMLDEIDQKDLYRTRWFEKR